MMILDAIDTAANDHAVYFLVTAYIESLCHFHRGLGIPESVVKLPLDGVDDLEQRLASLERNVQVRLESVVPASEVTAVLASAVKRLSGEGAHACENR